MNINLKELTITKARKHLDAREFSARELAEAYLKNIEEKNPEIFAYLEVYDDVLEQAKRADERLKSGKTGEKGGEDRENRSMLGIPVALKDNLLVEGKISTSASKILAGHRGTYDATVVKKLRDAGAVFLGRTNMDEFAMGASTENSGYGATKNPHDTSRVPGGSSGGSAAAVGGDLALAAIGSDTGGSIRQPAAFCGAVGLKPTYGTVSRYGLMAMTSSLDQIGPITKTVEDAEILFNAIKGHDVMDSTSVPEHLIPKHQLPLTSSQKPVIGVPEDFVTMEGVDSRVLANFRDTIKKLEAKGYKTKSVSLPYIKYSLAVYYIIVPAEVSSNLARFDGIKYGLSLDGKNVIDAYKKTRGQGFGAEARRRIMLGTFVLSSGYYDAYYGKANIVRKMIQNDFTRAFTEEVDLIALPTTPTPAFKIGEKTADPLAMYLADIFTVPVNIGDVAGISVPSGFIQEGDKKLPLGFQLIAPRFREDLLFRSGKDAVQ
ncbi:Asp-tRNA(Asn)/Glu-tRNA(Gln) amidotransferase subunit GatA [bacterium]|nr:Asp-tRNA(Asn)/Glu-tRNA(Gln) amidotransferase subunit GatA [bacterium]